MPKIAFPTPPDKRIEVSGTDEYWQARASARALMEAEAIKADAKRVAAARYILEKEDAERRAALEETEQD